MIGKKTMRKLLIMALLILLLIAQVPNVVKSTKRLYDTIVEVPSGSSILITYNNTMNLTATRDYDITQFTGGKSGASTYSQCLNDSYYKDSTYYYCNEATDTSYLRLNITGIHNVYRIHMMNFSVWAKQSSSAGSSLQLNFNSSINSTIYGYLYQYQAGTFDKIFKGRWLNSSQYLDGLNWNNTIMTMKHFNANSEQPSSVYSLTLWINYSTIISTSDVPSSPSSDDNGDRHLLHEDMISGYIDWIFDTAIILIKLVTDNLITTIIGLISSSVLVVVRQFLHKNIKKIKPKKPKSLLDKLRGK